MTNNRKPIRELKSTIHLSDMYPYPNHIGWGPKVYNDDYTKFQTVSSDENGRDIYVNGKLLIRKEVWTIPYDDKKLTGREKHQIQTRMRRKFVNIINSNDLCFRDGVII